MPEVIEKIKPTTVPIDQIKTQIREETEKKYQARIAGILKNADEKAERKFKIRIEELSTQLDKLSRSQSLQPTAPISDALEHPIVKTRMLDLSDKARDLLIKIEREPGLTRDQLAAFLTTSIDGVVRLIERINRIFRAEVIVGDGKPLRYRSMLKRLFITDVGKREIEELERLRREIQDRDERIRALESKTNDFNQTVENNKQLYKELTALAKKQERTEVELRQITAEKEKLIQEKKEIMVTAKTGEALYSIITSVVDRKLADFKPIAISTDSSAPPQVDMVKISEMIDERIRKIPKEPTPNNGNISTSVSLEHKITHFDFDKQEEHVKANTTDLQGRIIYLITKGFFEQRHNPPEVATELANNGWIHDKKDVSEMLVSLCQIGVLQRKIGTGNYWWYTPTPEAKERIHS